MQKHWLYNVRNGQSDDKLMPSRDLKINIQPVADGENKSSPVAPPLPTDTGNGSSGHLVLPPPSDSASPTSVRSAGSNNSSGTLSIFGQSPASPATLSTKRSLRRKLVVIGDGAAGKTSLLVAYKHGTFRPEYLPTVFENSTTSVPVESKTVELALWDTAGSRHRRWQRHPWLIDDCRTGGLRSSAASELSG